MKIFAPFLAAVTLIGLCAPGARAQSGGGAGDPARAQACAQLKQVNAQHKADMDALNAQNKQLGDQMKQLQDQRKSMTDQYRAQRQALMNQLSPGAGDALNGYDAQVEATYERQEQEIKAIRAKYDAQRKAMRPPVVRLNCR